MKKSIIWCMISLFFVTALYAQTPISKSREQAAQRMSSMTKEEQRAYYQRFHSRQVKMNTNIPLKGQKSGNLPTKSPAMPADMWYPGEWEELQAVTVTWPYNCFAEGNPTWYASPIVEGIAEYSSYGPGGWVSQGYGPFIAVPDTVSDLSPVFMHMINAIQEETQVWINLWSVEDTTIIKNFMARKGMPLTNYRFIISYGNSFWYRDCGPICFYYGDQDSVGMLDVEYYPGRALDDKLPFYISEQMGIPNYMSTIEWEGGNCLVDGAGLLATSDAIYSANADSYGQLTWDGENIESIEYTQKTALTKQQVKDSLAYLMNLRDVKILPTLKYDGGTGHIDLYVDMWDENSFVFSQFPESCSSWVDYKTANKNIDSLCSYKSIHNDNYKKTYIPFPKKDNGSNFTTQIDYNNNYTRTYSNHTFVNKLIIQPVFSKVTNGVPAASWDRDALEVMKKAYPGYRFYPIDVRSFDGFGGAIHCITKQIPAENPIRILHHAITGDANSYNLQIPITATITNRSGIASATCYWRPQGTTEWSQVPLSANGDNYTATLPLSQINTTNIRIEYYISATSNNGKTMTKPITAPEGYYTFYVGQVGIEDAVENNTQFGNVYPNPTSAMANLDIQLSEPVTYEVAIINVMGQTVHTSQLNVNGPIIYQIDTQKLQSGIYSVVFSNKGNRIVRKFVVY